MKVFLSILVLVCLGWAQAQTPASNSAQSASQASPESSASDRAPMDKEGLQNAAQAKSILDQAIQALGGQAYLAIRDRESQGRGYGFHSGRPTGAGAGVWRSWGLSD